MSVAYLVFLAGFDVGPLRGFFQRWLGLGIELGATVACVWRAATVPEERRIWSFVALAVAVWTLGDVYWRVVLWGQDEPTIPSLADVGWLLFYPPAYAAIVLLLIARVRSISAGVAVDGVVGALAAAAVAAAIVFDAVRAGTGGRTATVATNLAYPIADMVLLAMVVGGLSMSRRRLGRTWLWLAVGFALFALCDSLYLLATARETYVAGGLLDAGWAVALFLVACAAWRSESPVDGGTRPGWWMIAPPILFGTAALAVLVSDHFRPTGLLALVLAAACLIAVMARLGLTLAHNLRVLASSRDEALTDMLTGLGNRRRLADDLAHALRRAAYGERTLLVLFDLNGFKQYNDRFGHPAGDALLVRLGGSLCRAMEYRGGAYRMGGDEFCILAPLRGEVPDRLIGGAAAALHEEGDGFTISCAWGAAIVPDDAMTREDAVRIADRRMYTQKSGSRSSAGRQSADVLLRALQASDPALGERLVDVALLAGRTAEALGLAPEAIERVRGAAELHDVGKVGIPQAILNKACPLDETEWAFMRRHSTIGERIIGAAPALAGVARVVRAVHERWDGQGYPDGLAGERIPLEARIIAVCDAYAVMLCDRPYRKAKAPCAAVREIRRCAGSQFDPQVVEAFVGVQAHRVTASALPGAARPELDRPG